MRLKERVATLQRKAVEDLSAKAEEASDRRWAGRKLGVVSARLVADGLREAVPAVIRDMSATGAKIQVEPKRLGPIQSTGDLPDRLTLVLRNEQTEVDCLIVWRNADHVGVRFQSAMRPTKRIVMRPAAATGRGSVRKKG